MADDGELLVNPTRGQRWSSVVVFGLLVALAGWNLVSGNLTTWVAVFCLVVLAALFVVSVQWFRRSGHQPWQLRLNVEGVQARGHDLLPWTEIDHVRSDPVWPRWFRPGRRRRISFVPGVPGAEPAVLVLAKATPVPSPRAGLTAKLPRRYYGSAFTVLVHNTDTTAGAVADAVARFSGSPVRR